MTPLCLLFVRMIVAGPAIPSAIGPLWMSSLIAHAGVSMLF